MEENRLKIDSGNDAIQIALKSIAIRPFLTLNNAINIHTNNPKGSIFFTKKDWKKYFDVSVLEEEVGVFLEYPKFIHNGNSSVFDGLHIEEYFDVSQVEEIYDDNNYIYFDKETDSYIRKVTFEDISDTSRIDIRSISGVDYEEEFIVYFSVSSFIVYTKEFKEFFDLNDDEALVISSMLKYVAQYDEVNDKDNSIDLSEINFNEDEVLNIQFKYRDMIYKFLVNCDVKFEEILFPYKTTMMSSLITVESNKLKLFSDNLVLDKAPNYLIKEIDMYKYYSSNFSLILKKEIILLKKIGELFSLLPFREK